MGRSLAAIASCTLVIACGSSSADGGGQSVPLVVTSDTVDAGTPAARDGGAALPAGALNDGCAPAPGAGHQAITCKDGVVFDVEVAESCAAGGCGVILDVHGWSMTGPMEDRHTRMRELAAPKGFVVVQPTAPGKTPSWSTDSPTGREFGFDKTVWGFLEATLARFGADRDRVHMTGFSQGGMMTFRFLYEHGDVLASVAPIAGPDGFAFPKNALGTSMEINATPPKTPIPIFYSHGTKDRLLDFERTALPLKAQIEKHYGLTSSTSPITTGKSFRSTVWKNAEGRVMFEMWEHDLAQGNIYIGGHCIAGPIAEGDGEFRASEIPFRCLLDREHKTNDFDLGVEIVRFFVEHPRGK